MRNANAKILTTFHLMEHMILNVCASTHSKSMTASQRNVIDKNASSAKGLGVLGHVHAVQNMGSTKLLSKHLSNGKQMEELQMIWEGCTINWIILLSRAVYTNLLKWTLNREPRKDGRITVPTIPILLSKVTLKKISKRRTSWRNLICLWVRKSDINNDIVHFIIWCLQVKSVSFSLMTPNLLKLGHGKETLKNQLLGKYLRGSDNFEDQKFQNILKNKNLRKYLANTFFLIFFKVGSILLKVSSFTILNSIFLMIKTIYREVKDQR